MRADLLASARAHAGVAPALAAIFILAACGGSCDGNTRAPSQPPPSTATIAKGPVAISPPPEPVRATMTFADALWEDTVADGASAIVVAKIEETTPGGEAGPNALGGTARLTVLQDLARRWRGPATVFVGYAQYESPRVRLAEGNRGWNGVDLTPGRLVLIALPAVEPTQQPFVGPLAAVSVAPIASPEDPLVTGVERALAIEAERDAPKRGAMLHDAGKSPVVFLRGYAHYAMGRLGRISRQDAIAIEVDLLRDPVAARNAQATLQTELWHDDAPDDPQNKQIVAVFLQSLLSADHDFVTDAVTGLFNMLQGEEPDAADYRRSLLQGVTFPRAQVLGALNGLRADPEVGADAKWLSDFLSKHP